MQLSSSRFPFLVYFKACVTTSSSHWRFTAISNSLFEVVSSVVSKLCYTPLTAKDINFLWHTSKMNARIVQMVESNNLREKLKWNRLNYYYVKARLDWLLWWLRFRFGIRVFTFYFLYFCQAQLNPKPQLGWVGYNLSISSHPPDHPEKSKTAYIQQSLQ